MTEDEESLDINGGSSGYPRTWAQVVHEHADLLPRAPGPWLGVTTPGCPNITEDMLKDRDHAADMVVRTFQGAWIAFYDETPPAVGLRTAMGAVPVFYEKSIFPAEWFWWNFPMFEEKVKAWNVEHGHGELPSPRWLLDPQRMRRHYGWYAHTPGRRLGGLTTFSKDAVEYERAYRRLQDELRSGANMPTAVRVQGAVRMHFGGMDVEALAEEAKRGTEALRVKAADWWFIWGE